MSDVMKIKLPCGRIALIDDRDAEILAGRNWSSDVRKNTVYVRGRLPGQRGSHVYLHKIITGSAKTDHWDGNGLNNQRSNLRPCTQAQNCLNTGVKRPNKQFKGTYFDKRRGLWYSQIYINRKSFFGGYHSSAEQAARSYDDLAIKHHGKFARLNDPELHRLA